MAVHDLDEFKELLKWFENQNDPWFTEKKRKELRDLSTLQDRFCPCELHNMYDIDPLSLFKITEITHCMKRATLILPRSARGSTFVTDNVERTKTYFPPVHIDDCACENKIVEMTKVEKNEIIQQYKAFVNIPVKNPYKDTCIVS